MEDLNENPSEFSELKQILYEMQLKLNDLYEIVIAKEGKLNSEVLDIHAASRFVNLATKTLYQYACKDLIPCIKKGKRLYFSKTELYKWILSGRKKQDKRIKRRRG